MSPFLAGQSSLSQDYQQKISSRKSRVSQRWHAMPPDIINFDQPPVTGERPADLMIPFIFITVRSDWPRHGNYAKLDMIANV
ncbi:hypothetical protein CDAR_608671 [Caerostris darwini]|uniref:Uncharacterized protein n=1 Tax=Caerostris darwini TaxID=1538125 RepID=A0AAV4WML3_9ARAC|nr:hypothetical protein CDAR_608671 [Caerostris darwini]